MPFQLGHKLSVGNKGGRKKAPHTISAEKAREFLIKEVVKDLEPIVRAQKDAAMGMWIEKKIDGEIVHVYQKEPELKAGEYLLNQAVGRPTETLKMEADVKLNLDA